MEAIPLKLELWDAQYGPEVALEGDASPEVLSGEVRLDLERPFSSWQPIFPHHPELPEKIVFIDGVRRIETRIVVPGDPMVYGALGSLAVGCVVARASRATFGPLRVERHLILGNGLSAPSIELPLGVNYQPVSCVENTPEMPLLKLQELMRLAEEKLTLELISRKRGALILVDGPLALSFRVCGEAVGYIKRITRFYLPDLTILRELPAGSRTPMFYFQRPSAKLYSWFLRLAAPRRGDSPYSGLVRLEVSDSVGLERAKQLADATTALLPRFRSQRGGDPRAPQNLIPVGRLERHLRHALGDEKLLRREIQRYLHLNGHAAA